MFGDKCSMNEDNKLDELVENRLGDLMVNGDGDVDDDDVFLCCNGS